MNKFFIASTICLVLSKLSAQNLVPNWSFEDTVICPTNGGQIHNAKHWFAISGTPEYYNSCTSNSNIDVPKNIGGYQFAKSGNGYSGIAVYYKSFNGREYVSVKLSDTLITNKKYCITFFISLADGSSYGIDSVGAYVSNDSIIGTSIVLPYVPQVASSGIIIDTMNWVKISNSFKAIGGEKYLTIGNFSNAANTDTMYVGGTNLLSYYYIDDVSVYFCDSIPEVDSAIYVPNAFSPNGDGENDIWYVQGSLEELHGEIFTRWGERVAELTLPKQGWDGRLNGVDCNTGVYFYYLRGKDKKGEEIIRKGNVTLLR